MIDEKTEEGRNILHKAFDRVKNPENWKYPISKIIPPTDEEDLDIITQSIIYFTGSVPTIYHLASQEGIHISAKGYYLTIGS